MNKDYEEKMYEKLEEQIDSVRKILELDKVDEEKDNNDDNER